MSQQFCLKWNNHMNNMMDVFKNLLSTESMVDVTLACDGLSLKAHKMVLSACSPFFQSLFLENPCKHPIVILKDMKYSELKAIIEFMYHGEVNVAQDQLSALMKTAETLRVKGLAEVTNEKNSTSNSAQDEPGHRSVPRTESPTPQKRIRGRVRKRSLSDSNRSDDSNEPKIKQPVSPDIEELSGDITMDNSGQFSNLQSQVPMQSLPSHNTNSYHKSSSVVSQDPHIEEPASADESEFGVEPAKLLEQTLTTDDLSNRRSGRASTMSSSMEMQQRRPRSSTEHSSIVPTNMPSDSMGSHPPDSPPDIKPELLELEPPMSPVAGPSSHSADNSMMMYMDQSSVSSHPGTSYDNQALVPQDSSQPQVLKDVLRQIAELKKEQEEMKAEMKRLQLVKELKINDIEHPDAAAAINGIMELGHVFPNLPLKSVEQVKLLEEDITKDKMKATSLARFLCRGGGFATSNHLTLLVMKRLLSREVAMQYSLEGRQKKLKFCDLNLFNVVIASVKMKFKDAETTALTLRIGRALAGSMDWDGERKKRVKKEKPLKITKVVGSKRSKLK